MYGFCVVSGTTTAQQGHKALFPDQACGLRDIVNSSVEHLSRC